MCEECVETCLPRGLAETVAALNDLDGALLSLDRAFRGAMLRATSDAVEWMVSEYGGAAVVERGDPA